MPCETDDPSTVSSFAPEMPPGVTVASQAWQLLHTSQMHAVEVSRDMLLVPVLK